MARKTGEKLSVVERTLYLRRISELLIMGSSVEVIKKELNLSANAVAELIKKSQELWTKARLPEITEEAKRIIKQLDVIIFEAWTAWRNSITAGEITTQTGNTAEGDVNLKTIRKNQGNPQYLDAMLSGIRQKCKTLGLDKESVNILINNYANESNIFDTKIDVKNVSQLRAIDAAIYSEGVSDLMPSGVRKAGESRALEAE